MKASSSASRRSRRTPSNSPTTRASLPAISQSSPPGPRAAACDRPNAPASRQWSSAAPCDPRCGRMRDQAAPSPAPGAQPPPGSRYIPRTTSSRRIGVHFRAQCSHLCFTQRRTLCIGEEPMQAARNVAQLEANRSMPYGLRIQALHRSAGHTTSSHLHPPTPAHAAPRGPLPVLPSRYRAAHGSGRATVLSSVIRFDSVLVFMSRLYRCGWCENVTFSVPAWRRYTAQERTANQSTQCGVTAQ